MHPGTTLSCWLQPPGDVSSATIESLHPSIADSIFPSPLFPGYIAIKLGRPSLIEGGAFHSG